jgi:hypothetical protein
MGFFLGHTRIEILLFAVLGDPSILTQENFKAKGPNQKIRIE